MLNLIAALKPGDTVAFTFRRKKRPVQLPIHIGKRPPVQEMEKERK